MSKRSLKIALVLIITALFCVALEGCASQKKSNIITLNISAAASLKDSMDEIKQIYETQKTDVKLSINYGSSGTLQQQIEQGANVDIFMSAAAKQMDALENKELIIKETRTNLLQNDVVLIVPKDDSTITNFNDLITDKTKKIALGEPKSVPAGQYAEEVLTKLGMLDKIKKKAVYAKDVTEVLNWVETEDADAGIVYTTDAKSSDKIKIIAVAPSDSHLPVTYPAAIIKSSKNISAAKDFMNFLNDHKSKEVFKKYGFKVN